MDTLPVACQAPTAFAALQGEHALLLRYLGQVQQRLSLRLYRLETENLSLRAALLVQRTAWLWGLGPPAVPAPAAGEKVADPQASAHRLLCRVGCEGHAHAWLTEEGQCRRTGAACDTVGPRAA